MPLQLEHVLARVRMRGGKEKRDPLVNGRFVGRAESREYGVTRFGNRTHDLRRNRASELAGNAHDSDASAPGRRRDGGDRVAAGR
jgi:hypothetical protein